MTMHELMMRSAVVCRLLVAALLLGTSLVSCGNSGVGSSTSPADATVSALAVQTAERPTPTSYYK